MRVTYYLFKKTVTTFDQVWRSTTGADPKAGYTKLALKKSVPFEAEAYLQANKPSTPEWWTFVAPYCEKPAAGEPLNRSSSFVLLLKVSGRIFAVTFGQGFAAINRRRLEGDFGLKVTLNTVDPKKLRSLQARNIDPTTVQMQLVVNHDSSLSVFDVDLYQNLLAKIEGVPDDAKVGKRVAGADACYLLSETEFPKLGDKCTQLLGCYGKKRYQDNFGFVDQIRPVRDEKLIEELDDLLLAAMQAGDTSSLGFALPDIGDYDEVHKYRVNAGRWNETFDDLSAEEILAAYNADHPGTDEHLGVHVRALKDDDQPVATFTLRDCAVFQARHKSGTYVLTLNQWYKVSDSYAAKVEAGLAEIRVIGSKNYLPAIAKGQSEGAYNEAAAKSKKLVLLDKKTVKPSGATTKIEVCDLFSKNSEFIHVKRHTRSATLSHLLAQGSVSASLFAGDTGYRKSFRKALPAALQSLVDPGGIAFGAFSVVYAISAPSSRTLPDALPFFTKVNLLFHCRSVSRMGMVPKLYHIHET